MGRRFPSTLARAVPFWVAATGLVGCLADPPTFAPRGQIPPFIIAGQAVPPLGSIYEGPGAFFEISVPFRSEDVNVDLEARVYLDLVPGIEEKIAETNALVPAGNYEEERLLNMTVNVRAFSRQCHSLTLIMTYVDNLDLPRGGLPVDEARAARAVWWLNMGDTNRDTRMADCPGANQVDAVPGGG